MKINSQNEHDLLKSYIEIIQSYDKNIYEAYSFKRQIMFFVLFSHVSLIPIGFILKDILSSVHEITSQIFCFGLASIFIIISDRLMKSKEEKLVKNYCMSSAIVKELISMIPFLSSKIEIMDEIGNNLLIRMRYLLNIHSFSEINKIHPIRRWWFISISSIFVTMNLIPYIVQ